MHHKRGALRTWENIRDHLAEKKEFYCKKYNAPENKVTDFMTPEDLKEWNLLTHYYALVEQCLKAGDSKKQSRAA